MVDLATVLAILGILVPIGAFLGEFGVIRQKRLGYRVQMDTTPTGVGAEYAGAWQRLEHRDGTRLVDLSFALIRIENLGRVHLEEKDYAFPEAGDVGVRLRFRGRKVAGIVATEPSDESLMSYFDGDAPPGFDRRNTTEGDHTFGVVDLPKVKLNRRGHYKVLVVLERAEGAPHKPEDPEVIGTIAGGVRDGKIRETKSRTGLPPWIIPTVSALVAVILLEPFALNLLRGNAAPIDCASGNVTIVGSTAFAPVLREAAASYQKSCPDSSFAFQTQGSQDGLNVLNRTKNTDTVAFSDGDKGQVLGDELPALLPRPIAFLLFTLVANKGAGVQDLTLAQVKDIFAGRVTNWKDVGGSDLPVRIVDRESSSGTRSTLEYHVLGVSEPGENSDDCVHPKLGTPASDAIRCRRGDTDSLLDAVAQTSGAIGYAELGAANSRADLNLVKIAGQPTTVDTALQAADHGAYPFWQTEYAYTYGEPKADSLGASFLRYLTNQVGRDVIRAHGDRPCAELANPVLCRPS
ncbi:PstS family phosphate ABC transporter substrate-binding protein [Kutzneria sp. CA-103260]|uniref:PstS family phosphate ABC transporter substrate-binding protein n=1 Tax=Kutzneria sp. CA-103260 TaxID=2802641 RepID=UPI001BA53867|nr:substrate-binding domain-containing protein [Kutzneria sp. CA-103260]QUQ68006.1 phosphate binding protein [Kutzneria sp. CA-103260]